MRRLIGILAVLLCLAVPAMAAEGSFVPSIDYKDGPEIEDAEIEDEDVAERKPPISTRRTEISCWKSMNS